MAAGEVPARLAEPAREADLDGPQPGRVGGHACRGARAARRGARTPARRGCRRSSRPAPSGQAATAARRRRRRRRQSVTHTSARLPSGRARPWSPWTCHRAGAGERDVRDAVGAGRELPPADGDRGAGRRTARGGGGRVVETRTSTTAPGREPRVAGTARAQRLGAVHVGEAVDRQPSSARSAAQAPQTADRRSTRSSIHSAQYWRRTRRDSPRDRARPRSRGRRTRCRSSTPPVATLERARRASCPAQSVPAWPSLLTGRRRRREPDRADVGRTGPRTACASALDAHVDASGPASGRGRREQHATTRPAARPAGDRNFIRWSHPFPRGRVGFGSEGGLLAPGPTVRAFPARAAMPVAASMATRGRLPR